MMQSMDPMYGHIRAFGDMWEEARQIVDGNSAYEDLQLPQNILLCGMGGSSIGGALLQSLASPASKIPIQLSRRYSVPNWVGSETLVVCTSYSGNTEETLAAFEDAGRRGSRRFCITTGGELSRRAKEAGVPQVNVPAGLPPRAALPYTFVPILHLANVLGLTDCDAAALDEATSLLHQNGANYGDAGPNEATIVAEYLIGRIPIVYSGSGLLAAANLRWRGQIQENAKVPAFGNLYPELNHNEIEGWESEGQFLGQFAVIELLSSDDPAPVRKRMDITRGLLEPKAAGWYRFEAPGESRLAQLISTVLLGDWVSYYLAQNLDVDPMPVALIDALKSGLAN